MEYFSAGIDIIIEWDKFENLEILLSEKGNIFAEDDYNKQLIENGPKKIIQLNYTYDPSIEKFVRTKNDISNG